MKAKVRSLLYLPLCFCSLFGNALWFHYLYSPHPTRRWLLIFLLLTFAWSVLLTAIPALLPRLGKRIYMGVLGGLFFILTFVHCVYHNMFRKFFSFVDMAFAGDGFAFLEPSYLIVSPWAILCSLLCLGLMIAAIVLAPKEKFTLPRCLTALGAILLSVLLMIGVRVKFLTGGDTMIWDMGEDPASVYENFSDTKSSLSLLGLYHYTFRDIRLALFPGRSISPAEREEIDAFAQSRSHQQNEYSGALEGKNLILIQLEAIDTWMLEDYMPALKAVKEHSLSFSNHYTPAYITAGTFNTEFMVNTGLLPAATGVSTSVYTRNAFPNSLAHLFRDKGYTANSFHGSEGTVYNRGSIHENFGYERYHSGTDMGMPSYVMDSQLLVAMDQIAPQSDTPFFSFIITYSGHGPYGDSNVIYQAHAQEAQAQAKRTDGNYVYAVGHAMETDAFVAGLMEELRDRDLLKDTAVVFYADHYNYYMLDDDLNMDIKGVDSLNLLQHTDFFIYNQDWEPETVEKYTSSIDVLPTLANLFGLEADYPLLAGDDAFSDGGGYVFFNDNTWVGTQQDVSAQIADRRRINALILTGNYWGK